MLRIEYLLRERGISQTELADAAGINRASVNRIVNGHERAYDSWMRRIADALNWTQDPSRLFEPIEVVE